MEEKGNMSPQLTDLVSPQVYTTEVDQTEYQLEQAGPVGAVILRCTWKGRENDTVMVVSENDLVDKFGKPHNFAANYYDMFTAIGFLKEANQLYCTRVMPSTSTFAGTLATSGVSATFSAMTSATAYELGSGVGQISDPDLLADEVACPDPYILSIIAAYRGYSGNYLRVAVCDKSHYDQIRAKTITSWGTYPAIFRVDSPLESDKEFLILVQECAQGTDPTVESNWTFVEAWNVSSEQNKVDDLSESMFVDDKVNANSKAIRVVLNSAYYNQDITGFASSSWQRLGGGINTATGTADADDWEVPASAVLDTAIDLYANSEDNRVDVLLDGGKETAQKLKLMQLANTRMDCVFVMDPPSTIVVNNKGSEEASLVAWVAGLYSSYSDFNSSYGCTYGNWVDIRDKYASRYRWVPPSGMVGAVFARCIREYEAWSAPAGLNRGQLYGIRRLAWNPSLSQRDSVYKYAVNNIVSFAGQGKFVWSQKTLLDKESAFNQINVRMLFLTMRRQIGDIAKRYLFEANTSIKRTQFVNEITPILDRAKGKEGIEDYKIVCDTTNNTAETIAKGELRCDIWIKPVYAIRYIRLTLIGSKAGTSFNEV